ncbi:Hsp70 nucleotide exchange factor FES1 [Hypsizygus marmoreus]|uniref:Hsp70 nucleotide exchange factor FES1 n=1 Tax=Hypsizygus marmoreus TaxID=39966 RepID=A0A369JAH0_HYPMA|nr:Hsp70 nucleotide exchange factor FES1 [Hypsizygus marmoreus]
MQSLLRWSIENSTPLDSLPSDQPPPQSRLKDLDPGIIDMILGRPDAELMKEDVAVAVDNTREEDDRVAALDHLEMLIEQIDNANNLEKLKLWEPLHSLLTSDSSTLPIKMQTLWVLGTATQNNPSAQDAYLSLKPLPALLSFLTPSPSSTLQTRSKAIYALSGLLKHNAPAVRELGNPNVDGWTKLRDALQDPEITVRRKTIFLLGTLLLPTSPVPHSPPLLLPAPPSTAIPSSTTLPSSTSTTTTAVGPAPNRPVTHNPALPTPHNPPVFDNSHAAHAHDPSRAATSGIALDAVRAHGILGAIVAALTSPLPFGEDGEMSEADAVFEEQGVRLLHTYAILCHGPFEPAEKETLKGWLEAEKAKGGEKELADRWNLDELELKQLLEKVI